MKDILPFLRWLESTWIPELVGVLIAVVIAAVLLVLLNGCAR